MRQDLIDLYDDYTHARIDRRAFLGHLTRLAGGTAAAYALLPLLGNDLAKAAQVAPDDPKLVTERIELDGATGKVKGYLAYPKDAAERRTKLPAVVVIHENRGLNAHIEDVARRAAKAGFLALAPDALSPLGGTPADEDAAREAFKRLDAAQTRGDLVAAVGWLEAHALSSGAVGAVGFCWGGGMVGQLAVHAADLRAGVVFYGRQPATEDVAKVRCPLQLHYAGLDARINEGIPAFRAALDAAKVRYELHVYEGVNHAFHNDTSATRYDAKAAQLAWERSVGFLKATLAEGRG